MINSRKLAGTSAALGVAWALASGELLAPSTASAAECERKTWDEQPKVVIHTSEFEGSDTAQANMIDAITDVNEQLNGSARRRQRSPRRRSRPIRSRRTRDSHGHLRARSGQHRVPERVGRQELALRPSRGRGDKY